MGADSHGRTRRALPGAAGLLSASLLSLSLLLGAVPATAAEAGAVNITCRISAPAEAGPYQPLPVRFTLKNAGTEAVQVLVWNTPLEEQPSDGFVVRHQGKRAAYTGPMVKRGDPGPDEYVTLKPGVLVEVTVDLTKAYDITREGRYTVAFENGFADVVPAGGTVPRPRDAHHALAVDCPSARFEILD